MSTKEVNCREDDFDDEYDDVESMDTKASVKVVEKGLKKDTSSDDKNDSPVKKSKPVKKQQQVKSDGSDEEDNEVEEDGEEEEEATEVTAVRKLFLSKKNQKVKCDICKRNFANETIKQAKE